MRRIPVLGYLVGHVSGRLSPIATAINLVVSFALLTAGFRVARSVSMQLDTMLGPLTLAMLVLFVAWAVLGAVARAARFVGAAQSPTGWLMMGAVALACLAMVYWRALDVWEYFHLMHYEFV